MKCAASLAAGSPTRDQAGPIHERKADNGLVINGLLLTLGSNQPTMTPTTEERV